MVGAVTLGLGGFVTECLTGEHDYSMIEYKANGYTCGLLGFETKPQNLNSSFLIINLCLQISVVDDSL